MKSRELYQEIYGQPSDFESGNFQTRLAELAPKYAQEREARLDAQFKDSEIRDALAGKGALLDLLSRELVASENEELANSPLPIATNFDAYCLVKDASKENLEDHGLKTASLSLYNRWTNDPLGSITLGELAQYRSHYVDQFPNSDVGAAFNRVAEESGFHTLPNAGFLTRIASEVVDQESYERVVEAYDLAGDDLASIRARAYIKAIAEASVDDSGASTTRAPSIKQAMERLVARVAQEMEEVSDENEETFNPLDDLEPHEVTHEVTHEDAQEAAHDEMEPEIPHDGMSEEMATVTSPVSGEELVLELGIADDQSASGMKPSDEDFNAGEDSASAPLPDFDSVTASRRASTRQATKRKATTRRAQETITTVTDPSSGQELEVRLTPIEDAEEADAIDDATSNDFAENLKEEMGTDLVGPTEMNMSASKKSAENSMEKAMSPKVDAHPNKPRGKLSDVAPFKGGKAKKEPATRKAQAQTTQEIAQVCAGMGLTPSTIEDELFSGNGVAAGEYLIRIGSNDDLELCRLGAGGREETARVVRTAGFTQFDSLVGDFMALTAAQFTKAAQVANDAASTKKDATPVRKAATLTTDIPQNAPINARRIMASIWKIVPDAEGEIQDNGQLMVRMASVEEAQINRVRRVLSDVFQVKNLRIAQVMNQNPQAPDRNTGADIDMTGAPPDSPYRGAPPVKRMPAGAPAQPLQNGVQTVQTGQQEQQRFLDKHTDPMQGFTAEDEGCGDEEGDEADCADIEKSAQLDDMGLEDGGHDMSLPPHANSVPDMDMGDVGMNDENMSADMSGEMGMSDMPSELLMGDTSGGGLRPEHKDTVAAAAKYYRNTNYLPLKALSTFVSEFSGLLDEYGEENSPQRALAEAEVIGLMTRAFEEPAVVQKAAELARKAELPSPKVPAQQLAKVTVSKDWPQGDLPVPATPKTSAPRGKFSNPSLNHGDSNSHNIGPSIKVPAGQAASQQKAKGTKMPNTDVTSGTGASGDCPTTKKWDSVSKEVKHRSTKKGEKTVKASDDSDILVEFDTEFGEFHVLRHAKRIASYDDLSAAMADAERRQVGTEAKIFFNDGSGQLEEI